MVSGQNSAFRVAMATGADWQSVVAKILIDLGEPTVAHRLGIVYATAGFQSELENIETFLRQTLGVPHWVGTVGHGICANSEEVFGTPAIAVMLLPLPDEAFRVIAVPPDGPEAAVNENQQWVEQATMPLLLVHADPACGNLPEYLSTLSDKTQGFVVGGLSAATGCRAQIADGVTGGLSGVMISPEHAFVQTGLTQGCVPIGPVRRVTAAEGPVVLEIDGRPSLDVFKEDIGAELAGDLQKVAGRIFAGLPVAGHDQGDYLVRNLIGIDIENNIIAIGDEMSVGDAILFCKRDETAAVEDMNRMLAGLKSRIGDGDVRGAVYVSCCARGPNQFQAPNRELDLIHRELGDVPLIGFFANGEINGDRLYAYTGVLTVFL